jgi:hypothetical protein
MNEENHGGIMLTEKFMIRPPGLSDNLTSSHLVTNQKGTGEGNDEFGRSSSKEYLRIQPVPKREHKYSQLHR